MPSYLSAVNAHGQLVKSMLCEEVWTEHLDHPLMRKKTC